MFLRWLLVLLVTSILSKYMIINIIMCYNLFPSPMLEKYTIFLPCRYYHTGRLGEKSDVYSFGIVLLEIITNQPVIDRNRINSHITQWVGSELNGGNIAKIMDPNLHGDYDSRSAWRALELAMSCVDPTSAKRPTMSHVVIELKECLVSENSRRNMSRRMDSLSSTEVSMTFDSGMIPRAR